MDRHGKKAKAAAPTPHSERSDMKAKSRGPLEQIGLGARAGAGPRSAKAPDTTARTGPKPR
jgi:hypothetical protein